MPSHRAVAHSVREQDRRTIRAILDLAPELIGVRDACGVFALRGLVRWARPTGLNPRLLDYSTSANATGDPTRVVGYAALAFVA